MIKPKELVGKRIVKAVIKGIPGYDDKPYLILTMDDKTVYKIIATYNSYTGNSNDEYPRIISIEKKERK